MKEFYKSPRLYSKQHLTEGLGVQLDEGACHYLKNVLRVVTGDALRLFNATDGEFVGRVENVSKKSIDITIEKKLRASAPVKRRIHLLFAPIKKERMDFLIEKAVELGATDLYPILTQNADVRKINDERIKLQIIEAAEQCERMDIPVLHEVQDLFKLLGQWGKGAFLFAALERIDAKPLAPQTGDVAVLIGPAGGFTEEEKERICALPFVKPVSLGDNILRSETAVVAALAILNA